MAISGVAQCASGTDGDVLITLTDITALKNLESELAELRRSRRPRQLAGRRRARSRARSSTRCCAGSCVIDGQGEVVASNKAWQDFARGHGESIRLLDEMHRLPRHPVGHTVLAASTSEAVEKAIAEMQAGRRMNYRSNSIVGKTAMCIGICCRSRAFPAKDRCAWCCLL